MLFRAVLDQAVLDYVSDRTELQEDIEEWLDLDNPDYRDVCKYALLAPEEVYQAFVYIKKLLEHDTRRFRRNDNTRLPREQRERLDTGQED